MSWEIPVLAAVGLVAGAINVLAGGGSFLTLPVLMFLGLPATVANGTNRLAILTQNAGAVWSFSRRGLLAPHGLLLGALPATAGAVLGAWWALDVGEVAFRRLLAVLMVLLSVGSLWRPRRPPEAGASAPPWVLAAAFFGIGIYGGFIQAGVGFLVLGVTTAAGLDLVRGNALKVLAALSWTVAALAVFVAGGQVAWGPALALALGTLLGGLAGARMTVARGHRWLRGFVTATAVVFALALWLGVGQR